MLELVEVSVRLCLVSQCLQLQNYNLELELNMNVNVNVNVCMELNI